MKFLVLLLLMTTSSLYSLNYEIHGNNSNTLNAIMASGAIKAEDTKNLNDFLSSLPSKKNTAIYFNSPGGNLFEGMNLGKYFKQHKIKTVVQGGEMCASACALAFLGGTDNNDNRWMSTTTTSRLGFHSFSNSNGTKKEDMNLTQRIVGRILEYGQTVEAPMEIFVRNFQTPSDSMYWFSTEESLNLGIKVWDMTNECFVGDCAKNITASNFLTLYFKNIKNTPYHSSWLKLSNNFRTKVPFKSYKKWWSKKVKTVRTSRFEKINSNTFTAKLYYELHNGKTYCSQDKLAVIKKNGHWLINKQTSIECKK